MASPPAASARTRTLGIDGALDETTFRALFEEVSPQLLRLATVVCGNRDLAEDAVQNAWQQAWRKRADLRDVGRSRSWLMAIAANEARMLVRRERLRSRIEAFLFRDEPSAMPDAAAFVDLEAALGRLSADDRTLLALKYIGGYTSAEIGPLVGSAPATVRVRLSRLHHRLRKELQV
jgi:RNA polymerase sigma-70 factor (ECF subfamily)